MGTTKRDARVTLGLTSGYRPCACRDCMETAIGRPGALCHACEDAGCEVDSECQAPGAYGGESMRTGDYVRAMQPRRLPRGENE